MRRGWRRLGPLNVRVEEGRHRCGGHHADTHCVAGRPFQSIPISLFLSEWFRRLSFPQASDATVAPEAVPPDVHAADLADTGLPAAASQLKTGAGRRDHKTTWNRECGRPTVHLPLEDHRAGRLHHVKASVSFGLYYPPGGALYHDTLAELTSEEVGTEVNGFVGRIRQLHADQHPVPRITVTCPAPSRRCLGMGSKAGCAASTT